MKYTNNMRQSNNIPQEAIKYIVFSPGLPSPQKERMLKVIYRFGNVRFTRKDVQTYLNLHERSAQRLMQYMREVGLIQELDDRSRQCNKHKIKIVK